MNQQLQDFARSTLKEGLSQCTERQQHIFKRMYAEGNLDLSLDEVIANIPEDRLDWAMTQVRNTIIKNNEAQD